MNRRRETRVTPQRLSVTRDLAEFAEVHRPADAAEPILSPPVRAAIHEWMHEIWARDDLAAVNVTPRHTALFFGPPGCGKTTLAHHFAARLGRDLVTVKMDTLISKYVGATGNNIGALFETLRGQEDRCVLLLDEFDTLGATRSSDDQSSSKERNNVVNILLTRIEGFRGIAIAATNRGDDIDPALWRRFGLHLDVTLPGPDERFAILRRYLHPLRLGDDDIDAIVAETDRASPALLRQLMEGIKRALILNPKLQRGTGFADVFPPLIEAVRPHPAYATPQLWESPAALDALAGISWPPRNMKGNEA